MINRKQRYVSHELHHFVARKLRDSPDRGYEILVKILKGGHVIRPKPHDQHSDKVVRVNFEGSLLDETFVVPAATCFCDIPSDEISLHVEKYGPFGLSFRKEHLVSCGARPVMYLPWFKGDSDPDHGRSLLRQLEVAWVGFEKLLILPILKKQCSMEYNIQEPPKSPDEACFFVQNIIVREIFSFLKPFNSDLSDDVPENYYLEREWRMNANFPFQLNDVRRVFLPERFAGKLRVDIPEYCGQVTFTD